MPLLRLLKSHQKHTQLFLRQQPIVLLFFYRHLQQNKSCHVIYLYLIINLVFKEFKTDME